jgi:hypothetical protein
MMDWSRPRHRANALGDEVPLALNDGTDVYVPSGNTKPVWTTSRIVQQLTRSDSTWGAVGTARTITYSFYTSAPSSNYGYGEAAGFSPFTAAQKAAAVVALQAWADVANVTFQYVSNPAQAQICFGNTTSGPGHAWGYYPGTTQECGDVWINPTSSSNLQLGAGDYGLLTLIHEIGHALGLDHPGDYEGSVSYSTSALYFQDSRQYTVMSYFSAASTGASHGSNYAAGPLLDDIAAAQYLFGADMTTRTGNTVYGFHSTAGIDAFDFTKNTAPVIAIWDAGGYNTLDCSGYSVSQTIDLNEGAFSSIGGLTYNVAIAFGVNMQCAIGGSGSDTLIDNPLNDLLKGGTGNDTYVFGAMWGDDTIQDSGNLNTLRFTDGVSRSNLSFAQSGSDLIVSRVGSGDTIKVLGYFSNPAAFKFTDASGTFTPAIGTPPPITTTGNHAPVVSGGATLSRSMVEDGAPIALGLKAPTDADGDTLTIKVSGLPTGGTVKTSSGTAVVNGQTLSVTQLTGLTFSPKANFNGSAGSFSYTVTDGKGGSASQAASVSVTAVNDAPVVTPKMASVVLSPGGSVAVSSLFSVADVDSTITKYMVRETSAGAGSLKLGTTTLAAGVWTTVTASQLAQLTYKAGTAVGNETLQIKAFDGSVWSNTASIAASVSTSLLASAPSAGPSAMTLEDQPLVLSQVTGIAAGAGAFLGGVFDRERRHEAAFLAGQQ